QDERLVAADPLHLLGVARRPVVGRLGRGEVGAVADAGPLLLLGVPPDVALALRPRLAGGIGRGAVVDDPRVLRPRPAPLVRDPVLLAVGPAARGLVDAVPVDAAVDPRPRRRRAVRLERVVAVEERAVGL